VALGDIVALITLLLKTLAPDEIQKVKREIEKQEKENAERAAKIKQAIATGDVDALNELLCLYKAEADSPVSGSSGGAG